MPFVKKESPVTLSVVFPARALVLIYASKNYICILISPPSTYPNSMPVYLVVIMSCHA